MTRTPETLHQSLDRLYRRDNPLPRYDRVQLDGTGYRFAACVRRAYRIVYVAVETSTGVEWLYRVRIKDGQPTVVTHAADSTAALAHFDRLSIAYSEQSSGWRARVVYGDILALKP
jgi:hypothetical protein